VMSDLPTFTAAEVAAHKTRNDLWIVVHGKGNTLVYNVTEYVRDHPGGVDALIDVAGTDATAAYQDVGHSEDADEILEGYCIGQSAEGDRFKPQKSIKLVQQAPPPPARKSSSSATPYSLGLLKVALGSVVLGVSVYGASVYGSVGRQALGKLSIPTPATMTPNPFLAGFAAAGTLSAIVGGVVGTKLSQFTHVESGFTRFPAHRKQARAVERGNPHMAEGFLNPKTYKGLKVARIDKLSPNVFRFVFDLPDKRGVVGLPIGQHVAVKATVNGTSVSRSYTPTSNNLDVGVLELVIKVYPDGSLTGGYFANLRPGDEVLFRGPKGPMQYQRGLCSKIGMIAGGTGITPMFQLIRAICEDDKDTTEVSLIFANRSEEDILLRPQLESFARRYPSNFKLWLMLDQAPKKWAYGTGYVTADVMKMRLPPCAPDTKIMLCGPPGMVAASKKALASLGFQAPGAVAKMTDQIFCF
ncbi:hypothetical protein B0J15DRAFT_565833, partial [Fusarium solani]